MTNQEIALEITKILKPDIDYYTRQVRDKKVRLCRDLSLFSQQIQRERQSRRQNRGRIKSRVFIKQLQSRQECLPGLFLRISKPHDAINGAEDWI